MAGGFVCACPPQWTGALCNQGGPCAYGAWGPWTPCSVPCGGGSTNRTRAFSGSTGGCNVDPLAAADVLLCNTQPCSDEGSVTQQGAAQSTAVDPTGDAEAGASEGCAFSEWGAWSACNATCGAGTQSRVRYAQFYTPQCAASQAPTQAVQSCEAAPCQPPPTQGIVPACVFSVGPLDATAGWVSLCASSACSYSTSGDQATVMFTAATNVSQVFVLLGDLVLQPGANYLLSMSASSSCFGTLGAKVTSSMETPFSAQEWVVPNQMIPLTMQWTQPAASSGALLQFVAGQPNCTFVISNVSLCGV